MKHNIFSKVKLFSAMALVASVLFFAGCQNPTVTQTEYYYVLPIENDDPVLGTWTETYGSYEITQTSFVNESYEGNSLFVLKTSDTAGTIFIKYTKVYDWNNGVTEDPHDDSYLHYSDGSWEFWYPLNEELIGKWYAISYKNLTSSSISISGAFKADGIKAADTLDEAVREFTIANGYFGSYSECTK